MAPRTVYANLQDGLQLLSLWDQSLSDMGLLGALPCSATGTNAIALTLLTAAFPPNVTAYSNYLLFSFVAAATSTGSITINVASLGALPLYKSDATTQTGAGDILIRSMYHVSYNSALNSGNGGFQLLNVSQQSAGGAGLVQVTTASQAIAAGTPAVAVNRASPVTTALSLPTVASQSGLALSIFDWSTGVSGHTITITPNGAETIMRAATWPLFSNAVSLAGVTLRPSTVLNGWFIAP